MIAPGPLQAYLDEIKVRRDLTQQECGVGSLVIDRLFASSADVPALAAAVEAVLELHQPRTLPLTTLCSTHRYVVLNERGREVTGECPACRVTEVTECPACRSYEWPCTTYLKLSAALLGEKAGAEV